MATRSNIAIAIKTNTGEVKYKVAYCLYDGYPSGVGKVLLEHYQDEHKIHELINFGFIRCVEEDLESTEIFNEDDSHWIVDHKSEINEEDYAYLWEDGRWHLGIDNQFVPLTEELVSDRMTVREV